MPPVNRQSSSEAAVDRRRWLQLMGASLALAGAAGCRWEKKEIRPFALRPVGRVPGKSERFATTMDLAGSAIGLVVTSIDGRPIKVEGNPAHSASLGGTDVLAQAAILELYDPDRGQSLVQYSSSGEQSAAWEDFFQQTMPHFTTLRGQGGAGLRILADASSSPTRLALGKRLLAGFPKARWHQYEPLSNDNEREGARRAFGSVYRTHWVWDRAKTVLCLDADPLGSHPMAVAHARSFARGRTPVDGPPLRLYAVESTFSITGAAADHRLPLMSSEIGAFTAALLRELSLREPSGLERQVEAGTAPSWRRFLGAVAADLKSHPGQTLVIAGVGQPPEVHLAVHRINDLLENVGKTVHYTRDGDASLETLAKAPTHIESLRSLVEELRAGKVETLLILGGNPAYDAPIDFAFDEALRKAATRIHLGLYPNETSRQCTWFLPQAHWLEAWGDARAYDGVYSVAQPLIEPLHAGRSSIELLAWLIDGESTKGYDLVRRTFRERFGGKDSEEEARWRKVVHDGLLPDSGYARETPSFLEAEADSRQGSAEPSRKNGESSEFELVFCRDTSVYDGRFANNAWLQELPRPLTQLTWDNAAILSPRTAERLGLATGRMARLEHEGRSLELPVLVLPGQADGSIAVALGYGRTEAGHVGGSRAAGVPSVGTDAYRLRTSLGCDFVVGATVAPLPNTYALAITQDRHATDAVARQGIAAREGSLAREVSWIEYREDPKVVHRMDPMEPPASLWPEYSNPGHRWGMAIDLARCIGCGTCVMACQAENNIPVVGKEQVLRGRQMHWARVDRYFRGDPDLPAVVHQMVACQQCENAPCEQVCPVGATAHSREGLNDMAYNRCIGTRYCANNCPYKVRRFNYFNYRKNLEDPVNETLKMANNPEVTVRSRGVMEKCTYCVQRIQAAKIEAKNRRRPLRDGEVACACQQACPTGAIVLGDLNDPQSEAARAAASPRAYAMLVQLNVKPRTVYLARVRHPNPQLEPWADDQHPTAG